MPKKDLTIKTAKDHVEILATAAVNSVPYVGGAIGILLNEYIPTSLEKRKTEALQTLIDDVDALKEQINTDRFQKEEFISLFMQSYRQILINHQNDKIKAFRAIIINSLLENAPDYNKQMLFLSLTERLTPLHLKLLKIMDNPDQVLAENPEAQQRLENVSMGGLMNLFQPLLPDYEEDVIKVAFNELHTMGFHTTSEINVTMTGHGITQRRISSFGSAYLAFISLPSEIS